ncbi:MAG: YkgJ family cysteine cluster protein [Myxococcota bacterium]
MIRPDVEVRREGDRVTLVDPVFGRAPALPAAVFDAPDDALLRSLALLHLVGDDPAVEKMRDLRAGKAPMAVVALPGARFACQGSGGCCANYVFGPLTDADVERVTGLVGEGWFETRPDQTRFLHTDAEGRCVFLEGGNRCGLHARYGATSKPGFCQLFPLVAWPTLDGLRLVDNGECLSFPASAADGPGLREGFAEVQDLLPAQVALQHPVVGFPGGQCDFAFFAPLRDAWVESAGDLRRCAGLARAWLRALATFPVAEGPRGAIAEALATARPLEAAGDEALRALAADVRALFAAMRRPPPFQREVLAGLELGGSPVDVTGAFRHHLFGPRALLRNRPLAALARLALVARVARTAGLPVATRRLMVPWPPLEQVFLQHEARWGEIVAAS